MKRFTMFLGLGMTLILGTAVWATVPKLINFQGVLKDGSGNPVADGSYSVTFRIYDAPTGGNLLWAETTSVATTDGLFAILLGSSNPVPDSVFQSSDRWLGIAVSPDPEMPRQQLVSVGYAYRVNSVDSASGGTITSKVSIGPGHTNTGTNAFVAGESNMASGDWATVAGGRYNIAGGEGAFVGGGGTYSELYFGGSNLALADFSTVSGGKSNWCAYSAYCATIGGGVGNRATDSNATVGGGYENNASGLAATVGGGAFDTASDAYSTTSGGRNNAATGISATVGGGQWNRARGQHSVVAGGGAPSVADSNSALGDYSAIAGGKANKTNGTGSAIGGGGNNKARGDYSVVGGGGGSVGDSNVAEGSWSTVSGGRLNKAGGTWSTVGGGNFNQASGFYGTVPGGAFNSARAQNTLAAGWNAKANHDGAVVFAANGALDPADSTRSGGTEQMVLRADGGLWITNTGGLATYDAAKLINTSSGAYLTTGGTWTNASSKEYKTDVEPLQREEYAEVLEKLEGLNVVRFKYKADPSREHLGLIAEDVPDEIASQDRKGIPTADAIAFLMAALKAQQAQIENLQETIKGLQESR